MLHICDWISIVGIILAVLTMLISCSLAGTMKADTNDKVIDFYIRVKNKHIKTSIFYLALYYWLTLFSLISTIIVVYLSTEGATVDVKRIFFYSVVSLFCTIVNFVVNLRDTSMMYRECFIKLERAINETKMKKHLSEDGSNDMYKLIYDTDYECECLLKEVHK